MSEYDDLSGVYFNRFPVGRRGVAAACGHDVVRDKVIGTGQDPGEQPFSRGRLNHPGLIRRDIEKCRARKSYRFQQIGKWIGCHSNPAAPSLDRRASLALPNSGRGVKQCGRVII